MIFHALYGILFPVYKLIAFIWCVHRSVEISISSNQRQAGLMTSLSPMLTCMLALIVHKGEKLTFLQLSIFTQLHLNRPKKIEVLVLFFNIYILYNINNFSREFCTSLHLFLHLINK